MFTFHVLSLRCSTRAMFYVIGTSCICLFGLAFPSLTYAAGEFITTWKTDNEGISESNQITIPTVDAFVYDYNVDWGDGTTSADVTGSATHTYAAAGTYQVSITGTFPAISFGYGGDRLKLLSVDQWGTITWQTFEGAYFGCFNLVITADDVPDLSNVVNMIYAFRSTALTTEDLSGWDMSSVVWTIGMFQDTSFNGNVSTWDVSSVVNAQAMFINDPAFNQDVSSWNFASATNLNQLFNGATAFNQDVSGWNVGTVQDFGGMFAGLPSFNQDLSAWDVSSATNMNAMFYQATSFNQDLSGWDVSSVTDMGSMFSGATVFNQDISAWDISSVTSLSSMFYNASAFNQDLSDWNVTSVTTMADMFDGAVLNMTNYDAILTGWAAQDVQSDVVFDAGNVAYCASSAHNTLTSAPNSWTISDDGNRCLTQVTPITYDTTIDNAVYTFTASDFIEELIVDGSGAYTSTFSGCAECTLLIDTDAHTVSFPGLQIGDVVTASLQYTRSNTLSIGPFAVFSASVGSISSGVSSGFSPPSPVTTPAIQTTVSLRKSLGGTRTIQPNLSNMEPLRDSTFDRHIALLSEQIGTSPFDGSRQHVSIVQPGWFVRAEHFDTVYFITELGTRRPFWDAQTFFTWSSTFDDVVWVTDTTLQTMSLDAPVLPKPGSSLIKLADAPQVYVVEEQDGMLVKRHLANEEAARSEFGDEWAIRVLDVNPALFVRYDLAV